MGKADNGGPAFPSVETEGPPEQPTGRIHWHGVSRSEFFAAFALAGMCANGRHGSPEEFGRDARRLGRAAVEAFREPAEEEGARDARPGERARVVTVDQVSEALRREFEKIRDVKGELEADAALETLERWWAGVIPVPEPEAAS